MTIEEINIQLINTDIAHQTALQISKDFGLYGVQVEFEHTQTQQAYTVLFTQLQQLITQVVQRDGSKLRGILYQIDVSAKLLNDLHTMKEAEQIDFVAHQIIVRELKKVLSRLYYKQKKENEQRYFPPIDSNDNLLNN